MGDLDEVFDETKLRRYFPPPPSAMSGDAGSEGRHKRATSSRRRINWPYELVMEGTKSGTYSVRLYDNSRGYRKLAGRTGGLEYWEADEIFNDVWERIGP